MGKFTVVHVLPDGVPGPRGYAELIESLVWGLRELGHQAEARVNNVVGGTRNIVVGFQMLGHELVKRLPDDTIVYNLEQLAARQIATIGPAYLEAAARLQMWDYNADNVNVLKELYPARPPVHVPIGWAPVLERVDRTVERDIDVLFYGGP